MFSKLNAAKKSSSSANLNDAIGLIWSIDGTVATLNNHGKWHIDHIKPIASFKFSDEDDFFAAFNFANTQPLWAEENLSKGNCVTYFLYL